MVRTVARLTAGLALGAVWGVLSSVTNAAASPLVAAASLVVNSGWTWAGVAVAAGALLRARPQGALAGVLALLAMTTAYYCTDTVLRGEPFATYLAELRFWVLAALLFGSALGIVGASIRRSGVVGLPARLTVPVGAALEMFWLPRWPAGPTAPAALDEVRIGVLTAAALAASAVIALHVRRPAPVARGAVAPEAVAPEAVAPEAVAPEAVDPEAVASGSPRRGPHRGGAQTRRGLGTGG